MRTDEKTVTCENATVTFKGVGTGYAMLYLNDSDAGESFVALATYTDSEVEELLQSFAADFAGTRQTISWQDERISFGHILLIVFALIMGAFIIYGLIIEFR